MKLVVVYDVDDGWIKKRNDEYESGKDDWSVEDWLKYMVWMGISETGLDGKVNVERMILSDSVRVMENER